MRLPPLLTYILGCQLIIIQYFYKMEPQRPFKWSSKISAESKRSNISSCRSLERGSWDERQRSLNKQHTMIEVMSLEGSKKSDIYEKMLAEEKSRPNQSSSNKQEDKQFNPFKSIIKLAPEPYNNRFSYEQRQEINHICTCYEACNFQNCPCFAAKEQECTLSYCCKQCVQMKSKKVVRSGLNFEPEPKIFCTCKKTKCNKKYCTCFAAGQKCGYSCSCEDCLNCYRPAKMEVEAVCIVDEQIRKMEMPESMDFEPFSFPGQPNF